MTDSRILAAAKNEADEILSHDKTLSNAENTELKKKIHQLFLNTEKS